jgi:hypothetical protein
MTTKTPSYAQAKPITSRSGCEAATKHWATLTRAQALLEAQGTPEAAQAARLIQDTIDAYKTQIRAWYGSEAYRASIPA